MILIFRMLEEAIRIEFKIFSSFAAIISYLSWRPEATSQDSTVSIADASFSVCVLSRMWSLTPTVGFQKNPAYYTADSLEPQRD